MVTIASQALLIVITVVTSDFVAGADDVVRAIPLRAATCLFAVCVASARLVTLEKVGAFILVAAARVALEVIIAGITSNFLAVQALGRMNTRVVRAAV